MGFVFYNKSQLQLELLRRALQIMLTLSDHVNVCRISEWSLVEGLLIPLTSSYPFILIWMISGGFGKLNYLGFRKSVYSVNWKSFWIREYWNWCIYPLSVTNGWCTLNDFILKCSLTHKHLKNCTLELVNV